MRTLHSGSKILSGVWESILYLINRLRKPEVQLTRLNTVHGVGSTSTEPESDIFEYRLEFKIENLSKYHCYNIKLINVNPRHQIEGPRHPIPNKLEKFHNEIFDCFWSFTVSKDIGQTLRKNPELYPDEFSKITMTFECLNEEGTRFEFTYETKPDKKGPDKPKMIRKRKPEISSR